MKLYTALAIAALTFSTFPAHAEDMETFFKTFAEKRANIKALKAHFSQNTVLPDEVLETPGTLVFAQPRRIVMQTQFPPLTTLVDNRRAYEYDPEIKQVSIYDLDDSPQAEIFFLGFESDLNRLNEAYELGFFDTGTQPVPSTGLSITPKAGDRADAYFVEVRLYLDNEHLLPHKIHIINEDSEVVTLIERCTINPEITGQDTQISLAPGTYIIENDQMVEAVGEKGKQIPEAITIPAGESKYIIIPDQPLETEDLPPVEQPEQ